MLRPFRELTDEGRTGWIVFLESVGLQIIPCGCGEMRAKVTQGKPNSHLTGDKTKAKACLFLSEMERHSFSSMQAYLRNTFFSVSILRRSDQLIPEPANSLQKNSAKSTGFIILLQSSGKYYWGTTDAAEASVRDNISPFWNLHG